MGEKVNQVNEMLRDERLDSGRHFDKSQPWFPILGFKLSERAKTFKHRALCENMIRSEIDYMNLLKLKQTRFNWTIPTPRPKKKKKRPKPMEPQVVNKYFGTGKGESQGRRRLRFSRNICFYVES